jgi:hypothetical protein
MSVDALANLYSLYACPPVEPDAFTTSSEYVPVMGVVAVTVALHGAVVAVAFADVSSFVS